MDISVERNAYGRQIDSAIQTGPTKLPGGPLEMVYIRAPRIAGVGPAWKCMAERDGFPVLVRQGRLLAATFHPELSTDRRVHQLFVDMVREQRDRPAVGSFSCRHPRQTRALPHRIQFVKGYDYGVHRNEVRFQNAVGAGGQTGVIFECRS